MCYIRYQCVIFSCLYLQVLGNVTEFEKAVQLVIKDVTFDTDVVVSVFETNIRVLGYVYLNKYNLELNAPQIKKFRNFMLKIDKKQISLQL